MEYVAAVEKAAGGKLYQLVVDTTDTAEYLIKNKLLKKRVTIIPLDNVRAGRPLDHRIVQKAKSLVGNANADSAQNCVSIAPEYQKILEYLFSGVLVAKTDQMALDLCYNRSIFTKVISADGSVFDPGGVISGGARSTWFVLKEISQLHKIQERREAIYAQLGDLKNRLAECERGQADFYRLDKQRNLMSNKLQQISDRLQQSEFGRQQADIERFEAEMATLSEAHDQAKKDHAVILKEAVEIENRMKNLEKNREAELKRLEKEVNQKQKEFENAQENVENMARQYEGLALEIEELQTEVTGAETELEAEQGRVGNFFLI